MTVRCVASLWGVRPPWKPKKRLYAGCEALPVLLAHAVNILLQELEAARQRLRHLAQLLHRVGQCSKVAGLGPRCRTSGLGLALEDDAWQQWMQAEHAGAQG